ncbi:Uncharacterised protein [Vibrio cholerae]|uniref:Uncharacterized protein n=1 Tax=Vibrio cholerae TaxID=666 RepID=A0A655R8U2_VIBCL|nr:Uncharacterised protein [Vibrio cholerae]CSC51737.1 Uncharacterised protein [Vibrio cholerae]CSC75003.1 Uncharacterised protein [Vibrio cholerae]CSC87935.1 Uncharacterised protein [Vibrio cholerae]CSD21204.1 Uncharacterised protein [Vibrio cholerae]
MHITDHAAVAQFIAANIEHRVIDIGQNHMAFLAHNTREFRG